MSELFWLFFFIISVQPYFRQKLVDNSRQRMIAGIEEKRGSRVVLLVHRQETMGFFGFPVYRSISIEDSEQVIRAIQLTDPEIPLDIIIHTPGGIALAALQIAKAIQLHKGKVTVFVPHYAMSGGTLIALAADEIVLPETSVLGPVDPQIGGYPAMALIKTINTKPLKDVEDGTIIRADIAEKAVAQMHEVVRKLLSEKMGTENADETARILTAGTWTHDYPITCDDARKLGLPINSEIPVDVLKLMSLYPQPGRVRPTVEYLPGERRLARRPEEEPAEMPKAA